MIIDNVIIIPDNGIQPFSKSILQDGIAWTGLTVTLIIQRRSNSEYWNNSTEAWQVGSYTNSVTEAKSGQYVFTNGGEIFSTEDIWDMTWSATESAIVVYAETEEMQVSTGIAPDKQKVRDAMAITTAETPVEGSIEYKIDTISSDQSVDKAEILAAVDATETAILGALEEGHIVL